MTLKTSSRALPSVLSSLRFRSLLTVLPLIVLLVGVSTEFLFNNIIAYFKPHSFSASHLTIAVNLSPNHHLLGFLSRNLDGEGDIVYEAYNRFPPGGYMLMKLVTFPFRSNLSNGIYVARLLVLVFFVGAAVLAYWSLCRLTSNRWIALTVTLLAFSSTLMLRYNTMLPPEIMMGLFGFTLTFHGMVIFAQEGRFRQLVIKACIALLLDWHVLALLLAFILLGIAKEIIKIYKAGTVQKIIVSVSSSRYTALGITALSFGIMILAYNIGNEYYALNRGDHQRALSDLPTIQSMLRRTSITGLSSRDFFPGLFDFQFHLKAIGSATVPFTLTNSFFFNIGADELRIVGRFATGLSFVGVFFVRHRMLAATAVLSGFCWTIPMRNNIMQHEFEGLYFMGLSLFLYTFIFLVIRKYSSERLIPLCSVIALLTFISSSYRMSADRSNDFSIDSDKKIIKDFNTIRHFIGGNTVLIPASEEIMHIDPWYYYLSGSHILLDNYGCDRRLNRVDFTIQTRYEKSPGLLTPNNQTVFLYDRRTYEGRIDRIIEEERPLIQGDFDVYLTKDRKLVYVSDRCDESDTRYIFLGIPISLLIYPTDIENLPDPEQDHEFSQLNYIDHYIMDTKRNVIIFELPEYDIASIRTGQYDDRGPIWDGRFFYPDYLANPDLRRRIDQGLTSSEPIARSRFNIHLTNDNSLIYVREPCRNPDINDDFFLHVIPLDLEDLPEQRRRYEFDGLDFVFFDRGFIDDQRCAAIIDLPEYDIDSIRTGQYTDRGRIWQKEFDIPERRN